MVQAASAVKEWALGHSEHRVLDAIHWPSPSSTRDAIPSGRPEHYLQGRLLHPHGVCRGGSSAWHRPLKEGSIIGAGFDVGMNSARHLGGNGYQRLALEIGVVTVPGDVALILGPEAVSRCLIASRAAIQKARLSRVAELGKLGAAAKLPGLMRGEIQTAELEELAMVAEAAQVASFGENGQGIDRTNARHLAQAVVI